MFGIVRLLQLGLFMKFCDTLQAALAIFGMVGGSQLGLFMLGILYPCANNKVLFEFSDFNSRISKQIFYWMLIPHVNEIKFMDNQKPRRSNHFFYFPVKYIATHISRVHMPGFWLV